MADVRDPAEPAPLTLLPGQAVHLGHSCVLLDLAGFRVLLDPATLTGRPAAPFANLTASARTQLESYKPLFDLTRIVPSAAALARAADVVLYSHLHADHFNAAVLVQLLARRRDLRAILPRGAARLLGAPRSPRSRWVTAGMRALGRLGWLDTTFAGLEEYLSAEPVDLPRGRTLEVDDGTIVILRDHPRVVLRAFAVTHPRPLLWVPTPFEAAYPPVLGYEIGYDDGGQWRHVLLVGETALDAAVLQRIAAHATTLTTAFLPVDLPLGGPLLSVWYGHVCHAPPRFLALAARLTGPRTTIVPVHQGLWCYDFDASDVPALERQGGRVRPPLPAVVADALVAARAHSAFGPGRLHAWRRLSGVLAALPAQAVIADPDPGRAFALDGGLAPTHLSLPQTVGAWPARLARSSAITPSL